jgi:hypothetical protein
VPALKASLLKMTNCGDISDNPAAGLFMSCDSIDLRFTLGDVVLYLHRFWFLQTYNFLIFQEGFSMKLNDPFGRMELRHQTGYESMRNTLRESHIDTPQAAQEVIRKTKKRAMKFIGVIAGVFLPVLVFFPKALPVTLSIAVFLIAWIAISAINGSRYIQRYIDEDLTPVNGK